VESCDRDFLLQLRNHPEVRKWFFNPATVEPSEHARWFQGWLARPGRLFYIPEIDGAPIGYVRFERGESSAWMISVATAPEFQRRGHTRRFVKEGIVRCFNESDCLCVTAEVFGHNASALALFEGLGFIPLQTVKKHGIAIVQLELKK
jgi:RimJ/RimL family protein N-acetyltransferase